jgi:tetratricopeptide (TPR) repeat protein
MIKNFSLSGLVIIYLFFTSISFSGNFNYYDKGKILFDKKQFDKSKFLFEKDIVFNPKNEKSYLYLAKIFNKNNNDEEQEINLNSVLLLNPQNDEAIYMLTLLKIKQSDYNGAKELIDKFILVCKSFCPKKNEMQDKLEKLTPENAKDKN